MTWRVLFAAEPGRRSEESAAVAEVGSEMGLGDDTINNLIVKEG